MYAEEVDWCYSMAKHGWQVWYQPEAKVTHRVKRGETLLSIARLYRTTVDSLKKWNRIRGSQIQAGQRLTILRPTTVATN